MRTYKFRAYPTKLQQSVLWKHANKLNNLYNYFLNQRIENEKLKVKTNRYDQQKELLILKENDPSLKEIHSQVLQQVPLRLQNTVERFFKIEIKKHKFDKNRFRKDENLKGFPKFRSCKNFFGICYPQSGYKLINNTINTKSYGSIKFNKHREILGEVKQIYITSQDEKWFICVTTNYDNEKTQKSKTVVGVDVGITNIIATSDGEIVKNKNHSKYFDKQINKVKSRRDSQCKKNSRKWKFLSQVINKLYVVKNRKQNDFLHKISYNLSQNYDTVIIENLKLKEMSESKIKGINRELRNSNLGRLFSYLHYKCNEVIEVNPYNTSKMCNNCGKIHNMPLSQRIMTCSCGYAKDRDVNAAKNILCLGQAIIDNNLLCTI